MYQCFKITFSKKNHFSFRNKPSFRSETKLFQSFRSETKLSEKKLSFRSETKLSEFWKCHGEMVSADDPTILAQSTCVFYGGENCTVIDTLHNIIRFNMMWIYHMWFDTQPQADRFNKRSIWQALNLTSGQCCGECRHLINSLLQRNPMVFGQEEIKRQHWSYHCQFITTDK
jgi:hypothetical protein